MGDPVDQAAAGQHPLGWCKVRRSNSPPNIHATHLSLASLYDALFEACTAESIVLFCRGVRLRALLT
jgi:hypothetical protein